MFCKVGQHPRKIVRCLYSRSVLYNCVHTSVDGVRTFFNDLAKEADMLHELERIVETVQRRMANSNTLDRKITLKLKHHDFESRTRSQSLRQPGYASLDILRHIKVLFQTPELP